MSDKIDIANVKSSIFWVSSHHNPYNDYLFDELSKHYKLDVFYIKKILSSHPWIGDQGLNHNAYYLEDWRSIFSSIRKSLGKYDVRIIAGWNHPVMITMIIILALAGKRYAMWSDTPVLNRKNNWAKKILRKWWLNFALGNSKKIMVTGNIGVERFKQLGVKEDKLLNFPFATNLDYFAPCAEKVDRTEEMIFISSGRLINSHKGFDLAIKAFGMLKRYNPHIKFSYLIAGTGPDEDALRLLLSTEDLNNEVKLLGWIQQNELLSFYLNGDVFIHPSHFDPFPNVVLEAMACGLAIIGSNSAGSVRDRVLNGINGFIFQENDVNELSKYIELLTRNLDLITSMKYHARETALKWGVSFNVKQLQTLINERN